MVGDGGIGPNLTELGGGRKQAEGALLASVTEQVENLGKYEAPESATQHTIT